MDRVSESESITWRHVTENPFLPWTIEAKSRFAEFTPPLDASAADIRTLSLNCCAALVLNNLEYPFDFEALSDNYNLTLEALLLLVRLLRRPHPSF
jgi:hypothetical protein